MPENIWEGFLSGDIVSHILPPADPAPLSFQNALAPIINAPSTTAAADPHADPLLAPPIYGRWHAGRGTVIPGATSWLDELNLDARWRAAAAFGTRIIQKNQEALMPPPGTRRATCRA